jgi:hypothetical protein
MTQDYIFRLLKGEIDNNSRILAIFSHFMQFHRNEIGRVPFGEFAHAKEMNGLSVLETKLVELLELFGHDHLILAKLRQRFEATRKCLDLLTLLHKSGLESRHWTWVGRSLGLDDDHCCFDPNKAILSDFFSLDNTFLGDVVTSVVRKVEEERSVERRLTKVSDFWDEHKFSFDRWTPAAHATSGGGGGGDPSGRSLITIANLHNYLLQLEDDSMVLAGMLAAASSEQPFDKQLAQEKKTLTEILDVLTLWRGVQEDCLILARVLLQADSSAFSGIRSKDERELMLRFEEDFKKYAKLMTEVIKKPIIKTCCLSQARKGALLNFKGLFHHHRLSCTALLANKKTHLPRLNFISFNEILTILGGWKGNERHFQEAARNLLGGGVERICIVESELHHNNTMMSCLEKLVLDRKVMLSGGKMEICLAKLIQEAQDSLDRLMMKTLSRPKGIEEYLLQDYLQNIQQVRRTETRHSKMYRVVEPVKRIKSVF